MFRTFATIDEIACSTLVFCIWTIMGFIQLLRITYRLYIKSTQALRAGFQETTTCAI